MLRTVTRAALILIAVCIAARILGVNAATLITGAAEDAWRLTGTFARWLLDLARSTVGTR